MKSLLLTSLLFIGCASLAPQGDEEVLGHRDFTPVGDIDKAPKSDPRSLYNVRIENDSLKMLARFGGGCTEHRFSLYVSRQSANEVRVHVVHDANKDLCKAWLDAYPVAFDLRFLKEDLNLKSPVTLISHPGELDPFEVVYP
jgi:hypothetical protein